MIIYPAMQDYIKGSLIDSIHNLFDEIKALSSVLFQDYDEDAIMELAYEFYYANFRKPLKTLYYHRFESLDLDDTTAVDDFFSSIGKIAYTRFGSNWEHVYNAYFVENYNPLENYSMLQVRTPLLDTTNTTNRKQKTNVKTTGSTSVVPFNDTEPTLTGESTGDSTTTEEKQDNEISGTTQERGTDTLTRSGNIGVTTSQQMLQSELDLRRLDFQRMLFRDVEKIIFRDYWPNPCF